MSRKTMIRCAMLIIGAAAFGYGGNQWTGALTAGGAMMAGLACNPNIWREKPCKNNEDSA